MLVFPTDVLYVYYFWPTKAGLVVRDAKFTRERKAFQETSLEFLLPWPACAVPLSEDTSPPFLQVCVRATEMGKPPRKQVRAPHGVS